MTSQALQPLIITILNQGHDVTADQLFALVNAELAGMGSPKATRGRFAATLRVLAAKSLIETTIDGVHRRYSAAPPAPAPAKSEDIDTTIEVGHADLLLALPPTVPTEHKPSVRVFSNAPGTYSMQIFARRRVRDGYGAPFVATAVLDLDRLRTLRQATDAAIADLERRAARKPDLIDAIIAGAQSIAERKARDAEFAASQASDRKLAIEVAREALQAVRNPEVEPGEHQWAYYAEETRTWWGITADAMVRLADMLESAMAGGARAAHPRAVIEAWAAADTTALELAQALQRRLSREHGR